MIFFNLIEPKTIADGKTQANFPICTALSPSAKTFKVPKKYYSHQKPLLEQDGKRLSIDSGYAESNLSNGSNEKDPDAQENDENKVNWHIYDEFTDSSVLVLNHNFTGNFLTFGTEDIHQIHEIIEYHIFIWNCRSFEHNKHSVSSFSYQFSFSTLTELAQTNVTTKLLSKAAISNEYMIF